jgi:glutamine amidotransferase
MIVVIDYGIGNIFSILNSFRMIGVDVILSSERDKIEEADKIILPGVGFFREAMNNIERFGLRKLLIEKSRKKVPILGICLGMQILFEESEESPGVRGLGLLKGKVKRLPPLERIPHIGWNTVFILPIPITVRQKKRKQSLVRHPMEFYSLQLLERKTYGGFNFIQKKAGKMVLSF